MLLLKTSSDTQASYDSFPLARLWNVLVTYWKVPCGVFIWTNRRSLFTFSVSHPATYYARILKANKRAKWICFLVCLISSAAFTSCLLGSSTPLCCCGWRIVLLWTFGMCIVACILLCMHGLLSKNITPQWWETPQGNFNMRFHRIMWERMI